MTVWELYRYLESKIPASLSDDWDNDGLQCCPDKDTQVKRILLTLDITDKAVQYAKDGDFNVIISHHPVIFTPLKALISKKLISLVQANIAAMSFHTRLDALPGGVSDTLAEILGLQNTLSFGPDGDNSGRIGTIVPTELNHFVKSVRNKLGCDSIRFCDTGKPVTKVAIIGGSGKSFLQSAIDSGADTFLTGEVGYSAFQIAMEQHVNVVEAGHYFTENPVLDVLKKMLLEADPSFKIETFPCNFIKEI